MSQATLEVRRISGHAGPVPGAGVKREYEVCKLIDTTTCIGCKACEVACLEWNGYTFSETTFNNSYQTMPETAWNYWNLIKFNEHQREDGSLMLLMRKDQCMHCEEPGCLEACPADGAIVQYANGIVDFQQDHCIGCGYCVTGCPFNIPKFSPTAKKVFKCTLCADRVSQGLEPACIKACPTGCLHFGTKTEMKDLAETRAKQLREHSGFKDAGVYDPPGVRGTHVIYVLHDTTKPEAYGGLPADPHIPWVVKLWKGPAKWIGNLAMLVGGGPTARFWHPWIGLLFAASVLWMYKIWRRDMVVTEADRAWQRAIIHYIRNEDEDLPPIGRFNYGQKLFFWLMFYGVILLVLSGLVLWFTESIPWSLRWLRYLAIAVHIIVALATIGGFIIHVYMGTAMVRGGFNSIIRGEVPAAWAKMHHRLWYNQVAGESPIKK